MAGQVYSQAEIINTVAPLLRKYHAEHAILFGSHARRETDVYELCEIEPNTDFYNRIPAKVVRIT